MKIKQKSVNNYNKV